MLDVRSAMRRAMEYNRNRPAIIADDVELTFEQAWKRGCQLANALHEIGLRPGDKVAVLEDNCLEASDFFVAAAAANVVRVPLYRRNSAGRPRTYDQPHRLSRDHRFPGICP